MTHPIGSYVLAVFFFFLKGAQNMLQGTDTEASGWDIYPASDIFSIDAAKTDGQFERDLGSYEESWTLGVRLDS